MKTCCNSKVFKNTNSPTYYAFSQFVDREKQTFC